MMVVELWGGVECTVNRVGDRWSDQLALTGHDRRPTDIDRLAELGLAAVRYPVLWERVSPDSPDMRDWRWTDERMARLRLHRVRVIAGLVHHGSGPRYTNLLAPDFATGLAAHAQATVERFPWVEDWTPVNEPVTTARFSALYGLWYPHRSDEPSFWLALLNQIDATRLAMRAIRVVNPAARLIQTDDLGRSYATAPLRDQAAFDNMRRWSGWDLLCGRITPDHPLFERLAAFGHGDRLRAIADDPCPPDIVGINHYLTSDRFLDHRLRGYPGVQPGGNGRLRYVDVEAIRALEPPPQGMEGALREAWERYGIPLAVTEAHNGSTRDEQLRWTARAFDVARRLRDEGVDVRAVTSWALFGSSDWNRLLTGPGRYEAGAFDVSSGSPRATAMARLLPRLANGSRTGSIAAGPGWWECSNRLVHAPVARPAPVTRHRRRAPAARGAPILIVGATGTLGQALARACRHRALDHVLTARAELALDDPASIVRALETYRPWSVINAAGWVRVDDAESSPLACLAANRDGAATLAELCTMRGVPTVNFSSDLVFDGRLGRSYDETDEAAPLNVYGVSKLQAEQAIMRLPGRHLIVRTAAFFSAHDPYNFAWALVQALRDGAVFRAAADHIVSPTYVPHLADAVLDLVIDGEAGRWHVTHDRALSWSDFAIEIARMSGLDERRIEPVPGVSLGWAAPRPAHCGLTSRRGSLMPPLDEAIHAFAAAIR